MAFAFSRHAGGRCKQSLCALLWLLCLLSFSSRAGDLGVLLVLSDSAASYQTFAKTFKQSLPANIRVSVQENFESFSDSDQAADLIVTVGVKAGSWVAAHTAKPVLATMLPSYSYAELSAKRNPAIKLSAIYLDQPWERQVSLLRAALPNRTRIGVLYTPDTNWDAERLGKLLIASGATLNTQATHSSAALFNDLENILSRSDVLLVVPDSTVYNPNNIRNILLTSYKHSIPLIGLSQAYVNAGAMCAIFATPEQLAEQAGAAVLAFARTGQLSAPQYPADFTVAINQQVARSLSIELPSAEEIRRQMGKTKEGGF